MASKEASKVFESLRICKSEGILHDALIVDSAAGSTFRTLDWAGDRHLKSLLALHAMSTYGRLHDEAEFSKLCSACESHANLAKVFDELELIKLVDEGHHFIQQTGDVVHIKADVVEAVVGELMGRKHVDDMGSRKGQAETALLELVLLIFLRGDCWKQPGNAADQPMAMACQPEIADDVVASSTPSPKHPPDASCSASDVRLPKKAREAVEQLKWTAIGGGRLAARGRPSPDQLAALHAKQGATAVVTLLRKDEAGCTEVEQACAQLGLRWQYAPFDGLKQLRMTTPSQEVLQSLHSISQVAKWLQEEGQSVIVHCAAGLHRTGIYLYVLLRSMGFSPEIVQTMIHDLRSETYLDLKKLNLWESAERLHSQAQQHQQQQQQQQQQQTNSEPRPHACVQEGLSGPGHLLSAAVGKAANPIGQLNEYAQKSRLTLQFKDKMSPEDVYMCCAVLDGRDFPWAAAVSLSKADKKEAKGQAARLALDALGL